MAGISQEEERKKVIYILSNFHLKYVLLNHLARSICETEHKTAFCKLFAYHLYKFVHDESTSRQCIPCIPYQGPSLTLKNQIDSVFFFMAICGSLSSNGI